MARPCALFVHLLGNFWLGDSLREHSSFRATNPESESAILDEVTNNDGKPNPRISCSAGIEHARQLLAGKMKAMGLMALGQGNDYLYTVPGTKDDECPGGITNLIAGLPGSDEQLKEEYILLGAHLDGPYNQGPSAKEGNLETDNSYDDGGSVAAVLSLAKYFKDNPIKRSLLLILSDGEEGIGNVQTSEEWKRRFCQSSGLVSSKRQKTFVARFDPNIFLIPTSTAFTLAAPFHLSCSSTLREVGKDGRAAVTTIPSASRLGPGDPRCRFRW